MLEISNKLDQLKQINTIKVLNCINCNSDTILDHDICIHCGEKLLK